MSRYEQEHYPQRPSPWPPRWRWSIPATLKLRFIAFQWEICWVKTEFELCSHKHILSHLFFFRSEIWREKTDMVRQIHRRHYKWYMTNIAIQRVFTVKTLLCLFEHPDQWRELGVGLWIFFQPIADGGIVWKSSLPKIWWILYIHL